MIIVNYLANALPINNKTTGEISGQYPNLFVPAGITFSIWGVIYLMLIVFSIIQFREENKEVISSIGRIFIISSVLNCLWIFAWHYEKLPLSIIVMILLLISLIMINVKLAQFPLSLIKSSFGIYLGWICIATIANITAWLVSINWDGFGILPEIWTITLIVAGLIITSLAIYKFNNPFIGLSIIWAFAGIAIKQYGNMQSIFIVALLAGFLALVFTAAMFYRKIISV